MIQELESLEAAVHDYVENVVIVSRIGSTHDMALRLLDEAHLDDIEIPPTLLLAESQSAGHGRSGRPWSSPPSGLYLTWIRCDLPASIFLRLPVVAAAAAVTCLRETGAEVGLKWPNDLVSGNRKLGGLLLHTRRANGGWCVVSLGLNVTGAPELSGDARSGAASLAELLDDGSVVPGTADLAASFVRHMASALDHPEEAAATWRGALVHRKGDPMEVHLDDGSTVAGSFAGVTGEGFLRLKTGATERVLTTGEIGLIV